MFGCDNMIINDISVSNIKILICIPEHQTSTLLLTEEIQISVAVKKIVLVMTKSTELWVAAKPAELLVATKSAKLLF